MTAVLPVIRAFPWYERWNTYFVLKDFILSVTGSPVRSKENALINDPGLTISIAVCLMLF